MVWRTPFSSRNCQCYSCFRIQSNYSWSWSRSREGLNEWRWCPFDRSLAERIGAANSLSKRMKDILRSMHATSLDDVISQCRRIQWSDCVWTSGLSVTCTEIGYPHSWNHNSGCFHYRVHWLHSHLLGFLRVILKLCMRGALQVLLLSFGHVLRTSCHISKQHG